MDQLLKFFDKNKILFIIILIVVSIVIGIFISNLAGIAFGGMSTLLSFIAGKGKIDEQAFFEKQLDLDIEITKNENKISNVMDELEEKEISEKEIRSEIEKIDDKYTRENLELILKEHAEKGI